MKRFHICLLVLFLSFCSKSYSLYPKNQGFLQLLQDSETELSQETSDSTSSLDPSTESENSEMTGLDTNSADTSDLSSSEEPTELTNENLSTEGESEETTEDEEEDSTEEENILALTKVSEGIETLNENYADISQQIDISIDSLKTQADNSITFSTLTSITLIDAQIQDLQNYLDEANSEIQDLEAKISDSLDGLCTELDTCSACTTNSNCV